MRNTALTTATAVGCALLLLLAGCSNDAEDTTSPDGQSADAEARMGPLDKLFEQVSQDYDEDDYAALNQKQEEVVGACMTEQGFEYTPQVMDTGTAALTDDGPMWGTKEYVEQYGYGMTTYDSPMSDDGAEEWVDPNADYLETLSESQQAAFYEALYGAQVASDDPEATEVPYNWETSGCYGRASHEVYETGSFAAWSDPDFTALQEDMNAMYEQTMASPELTEVTAEWATCMADAGFDFETPDAAQTSINDQMSELYGWDVEWSEDMTAPPEPDPAAIEELRATELATALADFTCKESVGYDEKQLEVSFDLQQQFIDDHQAELDAWVEKYAQNDE